mgnify:CR=1 FL=1
MLLMGMQKKNSDMDSLMEHLEFKGINVLNVFEEGRVNNLLWQMNTRKNNELFIKHRYVVLYYLELVKKLSEQGKIKLYVVNNHIKIKNLPKRGGWLESVICDCEECEDNYEMNCKMYQLADDIVCNVVNDIFNQNTCN